MPYQSAPTYNIEQLQKVIDSSIDMISVTDVDGRYTFASKASEAITGYQPSELIGKRFIDFVCDEDKDKTLKAEQEVINGRKLINFNNRYVHKNGSLIPLAWSARWDNDQQVMYCVARDASELLEANDKLELSEKRFKNLVESSYDLIGIVNMHGVYEYVSPSVTTVLGYQPAELVGQTAFELVHPEDVEYLKTSLLRLLEHPGTKFSTRPFRFKAVDDRWLWVETVAVNKIDDPSVRGIVVNSRDVTERFEYEQTLQTSEKQYRFLFDNNPLPMMAFEQETGRFIMVNDAAVKQYGYSKDEFLQLNIRDIRPAEDIEKYLNFASNTPRTKIVYAGHWRHKKKNGVLMDVEIISHEIIINDKPCRLAVAIDITEKLKAQMQMQESEATLKIISENFPNGVVLILDEDLKVSYIAGQELNRLGLAPADFLYKSYDTIFPEKITRQLTAQVKRVKKGKAVVFELTSNNDYYLFSAVPYGEGNIVKRIIVAIQNITEQHNALNRIHMQSDILENVTNFIIVTDNNYKLKYYNKEATQLFGESFLAEETRILFDLFPTKYNPAIKEVFDHLTDNRTAELEVETANDNHTWLNVRFSLMLDHYQQPVGYLCMGKDITSRKGNEVERELLIQQLDTTVKDLRHFSYITSHNLRSPIANLMGITAIIEEQNVPDEFTRLLISKIKESTHQLNDTVNDLMNVLLIKNNVNTPVEKVEISKVWKEVCSSIERLIKDAGAKISADFSASDTILFNKSYLESIMLNLLTNAIKYRSSSRKLVISLKTFSNEENTILQFCDNGQGIDMTKYGSKVFGLYQRFHNHPDSKGLGLYLVNSQVKALGGRIEIESEVDKGTCFQVYFKNI